MISFSRDFIKKSCFFQKYTDTSFEVRSWENRKIVALFIAFLGMLIVIVGGLLTLFVGSFPLFIPVSVIACGGTVFLLCIGLALHFYRSELCARQRLGLIFPLVSLEKTVIGLTKDLECDRIKFLTSLEEYPDLNDSLGQSFKEAFKELQNTLNELEESYKAISEKKKVRETDEIVQIIRRGGNLQNTYSRLSELMSINEFAAACKQSLDRFCKIPGIPVDDIIKVRNSFEIFYQDFVDWTRFSLQKTDQWLSGEENEFFEKRISFHSVLKEWERNLDPFGDLAAGISSFFDTMGNLTIDCEKLTKDIDLFSLSQGVKHMPRVFIEFYNNLELDYQKKSSALIEISNRITEHTKYLPPVFLESSLVEDFNSVATSTSSLVNFNTVKRYASVSREITRLDMELQGIIRDSRIINDFQNTDSLEKIKEQLRELEATFKKEEINAQDDLDKSVPVTALLFSKVIELSLAEETEKVNLMMDCINYAGEVISFLQSSPSLETFQPDREGLLERMSFLSTMITKSKTQEAFSQRNLSSSVMALVMKYVSEGGQDQTTKFDKFLCDMDSISNELEIKNLQSKKLLQKRDKEVFDIEDSWKGGRDNLNCLRESLDGFSVLKSYLDKKADLLNMGIESEEIDENVAKLKELSKMLKEEPSLVDEEFLAWFETMDFIGNQAVIDWVNAVEDYLEEAALLIEDVHFNSRLLEQIQSLEEHILLWQAKYSENVPDSSVARDSSLKLLSKLESLIWSAQNMGCESLIAILKSKQMDLGAAYQDLQESVFRSKCIHQNDLE